MNQQLDVETALKAFESASERLRTAFKRFEDGKTQDPNDVAVATNAPRVFVEEAKARLDAALALERDRSTTRSTRTMVFLTLVITIATVAQAFFALKSYALAKSTKPVVCAETR